MRMLRAADRVASPWKNGGGFTEEIAVDPPGAGFSDFNWRISVARVSSSGPFSNFPGVDRVLAVLSGGPIMLHIDGQAPLPMDETSLPAAFAGDVATAGKLIGPELTDLNLMVRRGRYECGMQRHALTSSLSMEGSKAVSILLALDPVMTAAGPLQPLDAMIFEPGEAILIEPAGSASRIILATLEPL